MERYFQVKILAIDTSTMLGGVAIMDENGLIAEVRLNVKSTHSERLMTTIDYALRQAFITLSDINAFAIAIGPGSFTGLRIGLSTVKGLSYATGKPIASVPTLEAFVYNFPYSRYPVCIMLDARKKEVYTAVFEWKNDGFNRLIDERSVRPEEFMRYTLHPTPYDKFVFAGDGVLLYRDKITKFMGKKAIFVSLEKMVPSPANVAYLGIKKAMKGEFSEPVSLVPFYIRRSEAEIKKGD
jgi:tRNA threonylcarbamoyladenosine biosynthesis protein TsaB